MISSTSLKYSSANSVNNPISIKRRKRPVKHPLAARNGRPGCSSWQLRSVGTVNDDINPS